MLLWQAGHVRDTTSCCIAQSPGGRLEPRWLRHVHILLPCCAESYSRLVAPSTVPKTTPGLLCRGLLLAWCAKSYSRFVCRELCQELLMVCCAENCARSYSWSVVPRATPELCRDERQPIYSRRLASACFSRTQLPRCDRSANQSAQ